MSAETPAALSPEREAEWRALAEAATPGPWTLNEDYAQVDAPDCSALAEVWEPTSKSRNRAFIAAARTAVPELLAEAERLRAERDAAVATVAEQAQRLTAREREHNADREELEQLRARVAELERPAIETKRNEIRQSYAELIATAQQDRDFEGAFEVQCRLRDREEQWAREDTEGGAR